MRRYPSNPLDDVVDYPLKNPDGAVVIVLIVILGALTFVVAGVMSVLMGGG